MKATVTSSTKQVNVTSASADVLIHPRTTEVLVSVPNAIAEGGGSYVEKDFRTLTISPNVLAGASGEYTLDGGKQFFLLGYTATVGDIRIRGYVNEDYRDYDSARPINQDPLMNGGVLFELVTQPGTYRFSMPVTCYSEIVMPVLVESTSGSAINTSVSFFVY
jgi:hypothetical protein